MSISIAGLLVAAIGIILQIISIYQSSIHNKKQAKEKDVDAGERETSFSLRMTYKRTGR